MLLTEFVVAQLIFDVSVLVLIGAGLLHRKARERRPASRPDWYEDFALLARDVLTVAEPLIQAAETRRPVTRVAATLEAPAAAPNPEVEPRPGDRPADGTPCARPLPAEARLREKLAAAEARVAAARERELARR